MLTVMMLEKCSLLYDTRLKSHWNTTNIYSQARFERTLLSDDSVSSICVVPTRTIAAGYFFLAASMKRSKNFQSITSRRSTAFFFKSYNLNLYCCVHFWTHSCHVGWRIFHPARCSHDAAASLFRKWSNMYPRSSPNSTVFSTKWYASSRVCAWATVSTAELLGLVTKRIPRLVISDQLSELGLFGLVFTLMYVVESFLWVMEWVSFTVSFRQL